MVSERAQADFSLPQMADHMRDSFAGGESEAQWRRDGRRVLVAKRACAPGRWPQWTPLNARVTALEPPLVRRAVHMSNRRAHAVSSIGFIRCGRAASPSVNADERRWAIHARTR